MRILIACEYSGRSRRAFETLGHEVLSCDFEPAEDGAVNHYQGDVFDVINNGWDLMLAHPPCTYLSVSGLHWNKRTPGRSEKTEQALEFVRRLMNAPIHRIAIENPVSCISSRIRKPDQIIQPYEFGEDASKSTCLWLKNLPLLVPTKHVEPRLVCCGMVLPDGVGKYGCANCNGEKIAKPRWANQTDSGQNKLGPSDDRWKERSRTYQGIAEAWASQWGGRSLSAGDSSREETQPDQQPPIFELLRKDSVPRRADAGNERIKVLDSNQVAEYTSNTITEEKHMSKCSVCSETQFKSLLGMNCQNGHLNAPSQEPLEMTGTTRETGLTEEQQAAQKQAEPQIPVDKLVKIYVKIRDAKSEAKKAFDKVDAEFNEKLAMIATELKSRAQAEGVDGFKTEFGTVYLSETMKTSCADWSAFGEFLKDHDPLEFMEKRISSTAVKEYMKQHEGQLPPGVSVFKEIEARVRRAGEK